MDLQDDDQWLQSPNGSRADDPLEQNYLSLQDDPFYPDANGAVYTAGQELSFPGDDDSSNYGYGCYDDFQNGDDFSYAGYELQPGQSMSAKVPPAFNGDRGGSKGSAEHAVSQSGLQMGKSYHQLVSLGATNTEPSEVA